uniref:Uncharacterized protein n=1 Tax=Lepeophtheirus salmonis TaxID=72036 RepID=A0A0K2TKY6_LEPSM
MFYFFISPNKKVNIYFIELNFPVRKTYKVILRSLQVEDTPFKRMGTTLQPFAYLSTWL